jgi:hypothetical protein
VSSLFSPSTLAKHFVEAKMDNFAEAKVVEMAQIVCRTLRQVKN